MTSNQQALLNVRPLFGCGLLMLAAMAWGASNVAQKTALEHLGPLTVTGLSSLVAIVVLFPLVWREKQLRRGGGQASWRETLPVLTLFTLAICLMQTGFGGTSVTNAGFVVNCSAVLTPFCSWLLLGDRPSLLIWPAALMTLGGLWLLSGGLSDIYWGDMVCMAAAFCFALWFPLAGRVLRHTARPCLLTLQQFLFCGVIATAVGIWLEPFSVSALVEAIPDLLVIGLISKGLAYLLQSMGQQHTTPSAAAIVVSSEAVFGAGAAHAMLGETLSTAGCAGAALILSAIAVSQADMTKWRYRSKKPVAVATRSCSL